MRSLSVKTVFTAVLLGVLVPGLVLLGSLVWANRQYYLVSILVIAVSLLPMLLRFERRAPQARELVILSVMTALAVAGRAAFGFAPACKPVAAIVILTGAAFGAEAGFLVGAATAFVSNFFFGQGPWTPWQMMGFGLIGLLAGLVFARRFQPGRLGLCVFGGLAVFCLYGPLLDVGSVLMVAGDVTRAGILAALATGVAFNAVHAAATVAFLALIGQPLLRKLDRVKVKYGLLDEQTENEPLSSA